MESGSAQDAVEPPFEGGTSPRSRSRLGFVTRQTLALTEAIHGLGAFAIITLGVIFSKFYKARNVIKPLTRREIYNGGVRLMPMIMFLGVALGLVIAGQLLLLKSLTGLQSQEYAGVVLVTIVMREVGAMLTALLALARVGTATVIELGTARAMGEIEALEALGIDAVHYLVAPRVIGLGWSVFALTITFIATTVCGVYVFVFLLDMPLLIGDYLTQLANALQLQDFVLLAMKTFLFGMVIAVVCCYQGLSRPLRLDQVSQAATAAVVQSVVICVLLDVAFIVAYYFI